MDLYHGTSEKSADDIIKNGIQNRSRRGLDFGAGFYLTEDKQQAIKWAMRSRIKTGGKAAVLHFQLDEARLKALHVKRFTGFSAEWGNTIYAERVKEDDTLRDYDFVIGNMADGDIVAAISGARAGVLTRADFLKRVSNNIGTQITAKTQAAFDSLKLKGKGVF